MRAKLVSSPMERAAQSAVKKAFCAAFPSTIPILAGFTFLGIAYGIYMNASGFSALYPMAMSLTIFGGSLEFVAVNLLLGAFDPVGAFILALLVNARHLFYGIAMLDKYRAVGKKRWYLIFGMCDESFSINCTASIPQGVDRGWFYFFVTALNHCYWVLGSTLGGLFGSLATFDTKGLDFVMTALFIVLFLERWFKEKTHVSALAGLVLTFLCLIAFGGDSFIIPSMLAILTCLTLLRGPLERAGGES